MPYTQTWKSRGFKKGIVYSFYDFTKFEVKCIRRRFTFCTGDKVSFI